MNDKSTDTPVNHGLADPVAEQFVAANREQMQIPKSVFGLPMFMSGLFTKIEQVMRSKKPKKS